MPTNVMAVLQSMSRAQIERLLKAKERVESLQNRREELRAELAQVEADLRGLLEDADPATPRGRRKAGKKSVVRRAAKKTAKKSAKKTAKKTAKKAARKAAKKTAADAGKKATTKRAGRPAKRPTTARNAGGKGRPASVKREGGKRATLEDVVIGLITKRGEAMPFQELLSTITRKKLFATRSTNFDNVLRRTLSTSTRIKRVGRGMYGV